jgi:ribose transport system substrate-binding protein
VVRTIGGKGKVAVIRGVLGVATQEDRLTGFRDAIAGVPGIQCVAVQPANSERALGMNVMENILTSHPDVRPCSPPTTRWRWGPWRPSPRAT